LTIACAVRPGRRAASVIGLATALVLLTACGAGSGRSSSNGSVHGSGEAGSATPRGSGVLGLVTDEKGEPVPNASLTSDADTGRVAQSANVTGTDGRYFLPLPAGTWDVTIVAVGLQPARLEVTVSEGEQVERDVVLTR
jgi:hypothetical protein